MKQLRNENGQLTLEFMFACILIVAVSTLLGILTFTLSLTEVLQYVTYSSARSYLAADSLVTDQQTAGNSKAQELLSSLPFLMGAEASGWIKIKKGTGDNSSGADRYTGYQNAINASPEHSQFEGYQLQLTVPMLTVNIPFIKSAVSPTEGGDDFKTTLSSFLTREPAFEECQAYLSAVFSTLVGLGNYSQANQGGQPPTVFIDNGC